MGARRQRLPASVGAAALACIRGAPDAGSRLAAALGPAVGGEIRAVALLGSRADGTARPFSDLDLFVLARRPRLPGLAGTYRGLDLDLRVASAAELHLLTSVEIRTLERARLLHDPHGEGKRALAAIARRRREGPPRMSPQVTGQVAAWVLRTFERASSELAEDPTLATMRLDRLSTALNELYFAFRAEWPFSEPDALAYFRAHDRGFARLLARESSTGSPRERLSLLAERAQRVFARAPGRRRASSATSTSRRK